MPSHLKQFGGRWYYYRRVPKLFSEAVGKAFVKIPLGTSDKREAERRKAGVAAEVEASWRARREGRTDDADAAYNAAVELARLAGFQYRSAAELAQGSWADIDKRLRRVEESGIMDGQTAMALLGGVEKPKLKLSEALDKFFDLTRDTQQRYAPDQLKRWKNQRKASVKNFIACLEEDKVVTEITRADALAFRDWYIERVEAGEIKGHTGNKQMGQVAKILRTVAEALELELGEPFKGLGLDESDSEQGVSFTTKWIREKILRAGALDGLNDQARDMVLVMVEEGMRPSEVCGLLPQDIILEKPEHWPEEDVFVPHVKIRGGKGRRLLKTPYSQRDMPLIGCALEAMQRNPEGFPRYRNSPTALSAAVNSFLEENGLLPTDKHSLYSLRHSFADRLLTANAPDRIDADLKGHKFPRPKYGGPTLVHRHEWLLKIAVSV
ncbi:DUF6538 domain-containing protein [Methyloceanibacter caenitepidi]|uniref:Site-specific recombinase, phage integrase family n=1 Tax=Methyloceanibacter caenitepidi TaxID=1384459 RepID=A0A0A8K4J5_9HYPH|nr:DUF6538 domain-containing protein [Methyloceanibacter caenitepidi]BAQ16894.1 site-specific recombinase, phage integrase family [Methyloceanibacter caenitepidi]